jgi:hypothetical protein
VPPHSLPSSSLIRQHIKGNDVERLCDFCPFISKHCFDVVHKMVTISCFGGRWWVEIGAIEKIGGERKFKHKF